MCSVYPPGTFIVDLNPDLMHTKIIEGWFTPQVFSAQSN